MTGNARARRIRTLFDEALERERSDWASFLYEACPGDAALRQEVLSLLSALGEAPSLSPLLEEGASPPEDRDEVLIGSRVGPYRIVGEIGRGGMGVVYLAERVDGRFQKQVAIKIIRRGMDTEDVLRRFRNEQRILASLEHPHIARLLDGGVTEDGRPYFILEYVEGTPINAYCDARQCDTVQRLAFFLQVCSAVQYAHAKLVVHRDIKPGNILVTEDEEGRTTAKLLDFGIAKLLDPDDAGLPVSLTDPALRPMTPEYASPEQVQGELITTSSDVYALGVLLYELLTGHRPYRFTSRVLHEVKRIICEEEPEKPSTAITRALEVQHSDGTTRQLTPEEISRARATHPEALRRKLAGDLDNIVLMALRKEPQRRYDSVQQFAEDVRRYLEGLPVAARRDTLGYRTSKFVRRHRISVTAVMLVILSLVAGMAGTAWQAHRAAAERDQARLEATKAEEITQFLVRLFEVSNPSEARGRTVTALEILDQGAARIEKELAGQPGVQAALMSVMGDVYRNLGLYERARPLLEQALTARRQLLGPQHPDVAYSLNKMGLLHYYEGNYEAAEPLWREALDLRRRLLGPEHPDVAQSLSNLGILLRDRGNVEEAEPLLQEALAMKRRLQGNAHPDLAFTLHGLALLLQYRADYAAAEPLYQEALALRRRALGDEHPDVAQSLNNLALLYYRMGHYEAAEPLYREALAIRRQVYGDEHPDVAQSLNNLGVLFRDRSDYEAAEPLLQESVAMRRRLLGREHPDLAYSVYNLGWLYFLQHRYEAAEPLLREALAIRRKALSETHWLTASTMQALGRCLAAVQRFGEAEPLLVQSYHLLKAQRGEQDAQVQAASLHLAAFYQAWEKPGGY